jgi:predicted enzyme related to lactoylglutathione lyase
MWVDFSSSDLPGSINFYSQLFGWQSEDMGEEAGHYTMMRKNGLSVAAVSPQMNPQAPPSWTTYVATNDAKASADKVKDAGGKVVMEPFEVMDAGRMAGFMDPAGAFICVWQPGNHKGAELVNEPGGFCWNELQSRDIAGAKPFYNKAFGWAAKDSDMGGTSYTEWQLDGKSIAGGMAMSDQIPANVPSFWMTYFAVDDVDASAAKVQELGGSVMMPAMDSPAGRFAIVSDQLGASFGIIKVPS